MRDDNGAWRIYEIRTDGTGQRQVSRGEQPDVDHYDACYPGPMTGWSGATWVGCTEPYSNNHVMTCGPFTTPGSYTYQVCGAGICRSITVTVT